MNKYTTNLKKIAMLGADYRTVTKASLKDLQDEITSSILQIKGVRYLAHGGYDVCFDVNCSYKEKFYFSYHKGMEHSSMSLS